MAQGFTRSAVAGASEPTEETTTSTGTVNNFDLDAAYTLLRCNNASDLTITGFTVAGSAPTAGDRIIIDNIGSSTIQVTNEGAGSTAAHRILTESTAGQIIGARGRLLLVYDDTSDRWRCSVVAVGAPIAVAFDAANFAATGLMTWTVGAADQVTFTFLQRGKTATVFVNINGSSIGGTPNASELRVTIPNAFTCTRSFLSPTIGVDNGTLAQMYLNPTAAATFFRIYLASGAAWATSTDNTNIAFTVEFEID